MICPVSPSASAPSPPPPPTVRRILEDGNADVREERGVKPRHVGTSSAACTLVRMCTGGVMQVQDQTFQRAREPSVVHVNDVLPRVKMTTGASHVLDLIKPESPWRLRVPTDAIPGAKHATFPSLWTREGIKGSSAGGCFHILHPVLGQNL